VGKVFLTIENDVFGEYSLFSSMRSLIVAYFIRSLFSASHPGVCLGTFSTASMLHFTRWARFTIKAFYPDKFPLPSNFSSGFFIRLSLRASLPAVGRLAQHSKVHRFGGRVNAAVVHKKFHVLIWGDLSDRRQESYEEGLFAHCGFRFTIRLRPDDFREPPIADPHDGWCGVGRGGAAKNSPLPDWAHIISQDTTP